MNRLSSAVVGTVTAAILACVSGCQVEASIKTKSRFVEPNVVKAVDAKDLKGGTIEIKLEGVGLSINGGVTVKADPSASTVTATARMLAMAYLDDKASADQSISDAKETFTISSDSAGVHVTCGHGAKHGSSEAGESGCELVEITIPAGDTTNPLTLKVLSGNGLQTLQLSQAVISNVGSNSGSGNISATLPSTVGASVSLVSESGNITATMPSDWAADEVILQADADKIQNAFADAKLGVGAGGRGAAGTGLKSLKLTAKEFAGSTGTITLQ